MSLDIIVEGYPNDRFVVKSDCTISLLNEIIETRFPLVKQYATITLKYTESGVDGLKPLANDEQLEAMMCSTKEQAKNGQSMVIIKCVLTPISPEDFVQSLKKPEFD